MNQICASAELSQTRTAQTRAVQGVVVNLTAIVGLLRIENQRNQKNLQGHMIKASAIDHAIKEGKIVWVRYMGGSKPGSIRGILPMDYL